MYAEKAPSRFFLALVIAIEEARISSKGQIVIPKYLREAIGIKEGDAVLITKIDDKLMLMKKPGDPAKALIETGKQISLKNIRREIKEE